MPWSRRPGPYHAGEVNAKPFDPPPPARRRGQLRPSPRRGAIFAAASGGPGLACRRSFQPWRRLGRSALRRLRAVDTPCARPPVEQPGNARRDDRGRRYRRLRDRGRSGHARDRAPRRSSRRAGVRLFGAPRCARLTTRPAVLVSLHQAAMRRAASGAPRRCRRRAPGSSGCASASSPAPTTSTATSPPTGTSPTRIRRSSSTSATISTNTSRSGVRSCAATRTASRRRRCRPTATATPNIGSTRTCSACTPKCRRSSPGTTMRCRTTMPTSGRNISTIPRCSCCGGRRPTRRSTSTCRCVRSCRGRKGRGCGSMTASPSAISSRSP